MERDILNFSRLGDFNLEFLDYVEDDDTLQWVGNANELNAVSTFFPNADGCLTVSQGLRCRWLRTD